MKSTVAAFPIMIIMDGKGKEYIGDGKNEVDKAYHKHLSEYSRDNQILTVESSFSGTMTIQQIMKQYLTEQKSKIKLDGLSKEKYNELGNRAVVASAKEGGE